jgi:hypothetical protein
MLDKTEIILAAEALYWRLAYGESNPEVGMGPRVDNVLDDLEDDTGLSFSTEERFAIMERVETLRSKRP